MDNNYNIIRKLKDRVLKNFYPVYHAPLIFDINTQSCYRKSGYVAWPKEKNSFSKHKNEDKSNTFSGNGTYFAYPDSKRKTG